MKKNKMLILIITSVFLILIICFLVIKNLAFKDYDNKSIIFVEDKQLVFYDYENNKKIMVEEEYDVEKTSYLIADYSKKSSNYLAYVYDKILYLFNTKNGIKEKIEKKNIIEVHFSPNDKFLIYQDIDENIYSYNLMNKRIKKIISGDLRPKITIKENKLYIQGEDYVYLKDMNTEEEKQKIISDDIETFYINEEGTKILYTVVDDEKTGKKSVYVYDALTNKKNKVLSNVISYYTNDEYTKFIYETEASNKIEILEDDELNNDPVHEEERSCTYSDYKQDICTYRQYLYGDKIKIQISKKDENDKIREYAKGNTLTHDVYYKEINKESELIAQNINSIIGANEENKKIVYKKYQDNFEKIKISTVENLEEFKKQLENIKEEIYVNNEKTKIENTESAYLNDNDIYFVEYDDKGTLYYYNKDTKEKELIDDEFVSFENINNDYILYYSGNEDENYKLINLKDNKKEDIINEIKYTLNLGKVSLVYSSCTSNNSCKLNILKGNENKEIVEDVFDAIYIDDNNMYLFKNYSEDRNSGDLYALKNGKTIKIAYDVNLSHIVYDWRR